MLPLDSRDVNQLLANADLAMYAVKASGKNGYQLYDSCNICLIAIFEINSPDFFYAVCRLSRNDSRHSFCSLVNLANENVKIS